MGVPKGTNIPMECMHKYLNCIRESTSEKEKLACDPKMRTCIKKDCDTKMCDADEKDCFQKGKPWLICKINWFDCVQVLNKEICKVSTAQNDAISRATFEDMRLTCIPKYVKCRERVSTVEEREDCIWGLFRCIKQGCDTRVCDGYGKL